MQRRELGLNPGGGFSTKQASPIGTSWPWTLKVSGATLGAEVLRPRVALRPTIGGPSVESESGTTGPCLTQFLLELLPLLSQPLEWSPGVCEFFQALFFECRDRSLPGEYSHLNCSPQTLEGEIEVGRIEARLRDGMLHLVQVTVPQQTRGFANGVLFM